MPFNPLIVDCSPVSGTDLTSGLVSCSSDSSITHSTEQIEQLRATGYRTTSWLWTHDAAQASFLTSGNPACVSQAYFCCSLGLGQPLLYMCMWVYVLAGVGVQWHSVEVSAACVNRGLRAWASAMTTQPPPPHPFWFPIQPVFHVNILNPLFLSARCSISALLSRCIVTTSRPDSQWRKAA